jgi:cation diffusion facilitator family transporter
MEKKKTKTPVSVLGAVVANLIIATAKFIVAAAAGSSAMLAEAIHSTADTGNELLLLLGIFKSNKPADEAHPFGYGQELYFWGLIVAIILFGIGGVMSIYEGVSRLGQRYEAHNPLLNYVLIAVAFIAEGISWAISMRELFKNKKRAHSVWQAIRSSKNPEIFIVIGEDTADLIGLIVAFLGIFLSNQFKSLYPDAISSITIGFVLGIIAFFLSYETKSLLIGETADPEMVEDIQQRVMKYPSVQQVRRPWTMQFGPNEILINLEVQFKMDLRVRDIAKTIDDIEEEIHQNYPNVGQIFIEIKELGAKEPEPFPTE